MVTTERKAVIDDGHQPAPSPAPMSPSSGPPKAFVEVVTAVTDRATIRVDDIFLKIDSDHARADIETAAMACVPVPTPHVLWRTRPVIAMAALTGTALDRLDTSAAARTESWKAAGAMIRRLHAAPLPPWPGRSWQSMEPELDAACAWLVDHDVLPADVVSRNREIAGAALRPWAAVFIHGDLQPSHVFVDNRQVTGILDWSEAGPGDGVYDLATITLAHPEHLDDVISGYDSSVDVDVIRAWWSLRSLRGTRWLIENGIDPAPELAVLNAA